MRKSFFVFLLFSFLSANLVFADSWDDLVDVDKAFDSQKTINNKDYEDVVEALQEKKDTTDFKKKKKKFKKLFGGGGTTLHKELNPEKDFKENIVVKPNDEGVLTNIFVDLLIDGKVLEKGYYKIFAERDSEKKIHVKFYQSQFLKAEVIAQETHDDYGEDVIDFAKIVPYNESFVKMIYGSIDFNAYVFIPFLE